MSNLSPGQFSDWYHGTTSAKAAGAAVEGLRANGYGRESGYEHPLVTRDRGEARRYAQDAAKYSRYDSPDTGSVVTLRVPHSDAGDYLVSPRGDRSGLHKPLPKHMVHKVDEI